MGRQMISEPEATLHDEPFRTRIEDLATAIEERPGIEVDEVPPTRSSRHLYWMVGGLCALIIGIAEVGILLRGNMLDAPAPPPEVRAIYEHDPCAARMAAVMDALTAYRLARGKPPSALTALYPDYLAFPPVDPATNQPYGYEVIGESISLTCPLSDTAAPADQGSARPPDA